MANRERPNFRHLFAAAEALALLQNWPWRRPIDARLLLGLIGCGLLGAALSIRSVGWIIGPRATGESTLQTAIAGRLAAERARPNPGLDLADVAA